MSWHFSRALADRFSEGHSADSSLAALLKTTPSESGYYSHGKTTIRSALSRSGTTYAPLTVFHGEELLTWFLRASRARTSPMARILAPASPASVADSGATPRELLAKFDPATRSWKTHRLSPRAASKSSWLIWPDWGMMRNGECFGLTKLELTIPAKDGSLSHPTPTKCDAKGATTRAMLRAEKKRSAYLRYWLHRRFPSDRTTYPAPGFYELAMGFPMQWTRFAPLETHRFQQWLDSHGKLCAPPALTRKIPA